jgi:hypothetical protein
MSNVRPHLTRPVPPWLSQLVWFLAGVFATGAIWFFLSRDEYLPAWLSVAATVVLLVVAVQLHRVNDRDARFRGRREALSVFAEQASSLAAKASEEPLPIEAHNEWVSRVEAYLGKELDASYAARFRNFSGMTFYGDGSPRSNYKNSLDGRTRRLHEFISEFAE